MASGLGAIGAEVRLVFTRNHVYPELFVGSADDFNHEIKPLLDDLYAGLFHDENRYYYHVNEKGVWLNMDYGRHPGDRFLDEEVWRLVGF